MKEQTEQINLNNLGYTYSDLLSEFNMLGVNESQIAKFLDIDDFSEQHKQNKLILLYLKKQLEYIQNGSTKVKDIFK